MSTETQRLQELSDQLASYGIDAGVEELAQMELSFRPRPPRPLLQLRTGELVTEEELARRCEEQRKAASQQKMRGLHPTVIIIDEAMDLDPEM